MRKRYVLQAIMSLILSTGILMSAAGCDRQPSQEQNAVEYTDTAVAATTVFSITVDATTGTTTAATTVMVVATTTTASPTTRTTATQLELTENAADTATTTSIPVFRETVRKTTQTPTSKHTTTTTKRKAVTTSPAETRGDVVYITPTGKRYHLSATCGGKNSTESTLEIALDMGLTPCKKCAQ